MWQSHITKLFSVSFEWKKWVNVKVKNFSEVWRWKEMRQGREKTILKREQVSERLSGGWFCRWARSCPVRTRRRACRAGVGPGFVGWVPYESHQPNGDVKWIFCTFLFLKCEFKICYLGKRNRGSSCHWRPSPPADLSSSCAQGEDGCSCPEEVLHCRLLGVAHGPPGIPVKLEGELWGECEALGAFGKWWLLSDGLVFTTQLPFSSPSAQNTMQKAF